MFNDMRQHLLSFLYKLINQSINCVKEATLAMQLRFYKFMAGKYLISLVLLVLSKKQEQTTTKYLTPSYFCGASFKLH